MIKKEDDKLVIENPGSIRTGKKQMLRGGISDPRNKTLMKMFNMIGIGERAGSDKLDVKIEKLKDDNVASMITLSEQSRRMQEMMKMYGMAGMGMDMGGESTLILNANHPLVTYVVENKDSENTNIICKQLYDLAMLAHKPLNPDEMTAFVKRSNEIMMMLTK